jgi:pyruvate/2-oxoglutarate dehydrogenase complex dihydrolipoamide acyltransferase (E2) component
MTVLITTLPPAPSRADPATFADKGDALFGALAKYVTEANAQNTENNSLNATVAANASNAGISQTAAAASQSAAASSATAALASQTAAAASATTATQQAALATASVASGARPFATFAAASAAFGTLTAGQIIDVVTDEARGSQRSLYQAVGSPVSSLTFLRAVEMYNSPFAYIPSDSVNNMITRLLVATGMVPQNAPSLRFNFDDGVFQQN